MSDHDVTRALHALKRNGLPVPMSDEAALAFAAAWITQKALERTQELRPMAPAPGPAQLRGMLDGVTDSVWRCYKRIQANQENSKQGESR